MAPHNTEMKEMKHQKIVMYGIGIFILETILMGIWFYANKPSINYTSKENNIGTPKK